MVWPGQQSKLACAVSDAGGLGIIGCGERNTCFRRQAGLEQIIKRGCKNAFVPIENSKVRVTYWNYLQSLGFNASSFIRILW